MKPNDPRDDLHRYLKAAREAIIWKLDGLSEYDIRRPLTPTGTNLLGLVKHLATVELGYFGSTFGRPHNESLPWLAEGSAPNSDMWVCADETREDILSLYRRAWAHADATIEALPLDAMGHVPPHPWLVRGSNEDHLDRRPGKAAPGDTSATLRPHGHVTACESPNRPGLLTTSGST